MQYNIFKISKVEEMKMDMANVGFKKRGKEIESSEYKMNLYCRCDYNQKISWEKIFHDFDENDIPTKVGISSVIICESNKLNYAITYGFSSFLVQKYSDKEFGFNFAKRINLKELKRKSSMNPHSNRNASITSYKNTKTILFDSGENITSLSFSPENEFYGKRIDIGKSIKFVVDIPLKEISDLLHSIERDLKNPIINKIPLLTKITKDEDIQRLSEKMFDDLEEKCNSYLSNDNTSEFFINDFYVVGSSIYFEDEYSKVIKIGKIEKETDLYELRDIFNLSKEIELDIRTILEKGKLIYKDSFGKRLYSENIIKFINYENVEENVSYYDGEWFYYNNDYYDLVMDEINTIEVKYEKDDNISKADLMKYKSNKVEYREQILNKILSKKYKGILLDRDLLISKYENENFNSSYKIELADFIIEKEYISLKIGNSQALSYCVDQSSLAAKLINVKKADLSKEKLPTPDSIGVWFYFESNTIFKNNTCDIKKVVSIMLLSKLSEWSKSIKIYGQKPIIHVNKYSK